MDTPTSPAAPPIPREAAVLSFITWIAVAMGAFVSAVCFRLVYEDWRDGRDK